MSCLFQVEMVSKMYHKVNQMNAVCTLAAVIALVAAANCTVFAQINSNGTNPMLNNNVWIDQKLGAQVPLSAEFRDESNKVVRFGDFLGKRPAILVLPFYKCAGACTLELDGLVKVLNSISISAGNEFDVIVVSIDPREGFTLAQAKKRDYMELYTRPDGDKASVGKGWHFLTGTSSSIQALTSAVGYRYTQDPKSGLIAHPIGLIYMTPEGKVSHYLFGVDYSPRDVKLALVDASDNRIGSLSEYAALLCSHADSNGKYTVAVNRILEIAAGGTVLTLAVFIGLMFKMERTRARLHPVPFTGTKVGPA
jgi:protein SCO1/2